MSRQERRHEIAQAMRLARYRERLLALFGNCNANTVRDAFKAGAITREQAQALGAFKARVAS